MEIRNWNEIIGKNGIRIEIEFFFPNGNNTACHQTEVTFPPLPQPNPVLDLATPVFKCMMSVGVVN